MKATFENTVDILVKAYLNGTLTHGDCEACAVGNIVGGHREWKLLFYTDPSNGKRSINSNCGLTGLELRKKRYEALKLVSASGYTVKQLSAIEYAFETAPRKCKHQDGKNDEWMFNGLMAVVDVLAEIHNIDLTAKEEAKKLFVKVETL